MPKTDYIMLLGMCDLCRVNGVDIIITRALFEAGIHSIQAFTETSLDTLEGNLTKIKATSSLYKEYPALEQDLARDNIVQLRKSAIDQGIKPFLKVMT